MEISKADFNSVALYMEEEQVTIPCHTTESHANTVKPRNVTSTTTVTPTPMVIKPRNVMNATTVMTTPVIDFMSASPDVKVINALDVKVTNKPNIKAVDSPLIDQTPPESPTYEVAPVKQQGTLYDFSFYIDQGTFGIPCRGKIYHPCFTWYGPSCLALREVCMLAKDPGTACSSGFQEGTSR